MNNKNAMCSNSCRFYVIETRDKLADAHINTTQTVGDCHVTHWTFGLRQQQLLSTTNSAVAERPRDASCR